MKTSRILGVVTVLLVAFAAPASAADEVPVKGTVTGIHWIDESAPGCPAGALWRFNSSGTGRVSHLGKVSYELTQCTYFDPAQGFVFGNGTITFIAANGDSLVIAQIGTSDVVGDMEGFTGEGTWTAIGETGRFAHATGSGSMAIIGDIPGGDALFGLPDGIAQFSFMGKVAYNASDRSDR